MKDNPWGYLTFDPYSRHLALNGRQLEQFERLELRLPNDHVTPVEVISVEHRPRLQLLLGHDELRFRPQKVGHLWQSLDTLSGALVRIRDIPPRAQLIRQNPESIALWPDFHAADRAADQLQYDKIPRPYLLLADWQDAQFRFKEPR
jgi:hypothetical protein